MSQSLYLKYRPQGFDAVVGQEHVIDILRAQLARQEFNSSYLLYGPRGTGKTSTARLLAKAVNATPNKEGDIDRDNDPAIVHIQKGDTLDFVEIDAASHTGVDNIRDEIIDKSIYPPTTLRKKVYIIDEVHMLSKGAFNALLKIMEEPRDYLMFILATTEIHKVPDTIISRCQTFTFRSLTIDQIVGRLRDISSQEGIAYEEEGLELLAKLSNGALRDAIKYLEQISILGEITADSVSKFLGVVPGVVVERIMKALYERNYTQFDEILADLVGRGADLQSLIKDIFRRLDVHFSEDPKTWSPWITIFKEISSEMRWYPQPELLWRKKVRMWCFQEGGEDGLQEIKMNTEKRGVEPKKEISEEPLQKTSGTGKGGSPKPLVESGDDTSVPVDGTTDDVAVENVSSSATNKAFSGSLEALLSDITTKVDKKMIQGILSKQTTIDSFENGVITMIVINRVYAATLSKDDAVRLLEDVAKDILGYAVKIQVHYMSKEDFMKKKLEG